MKFVDAVFRCHVRSAIFRACNTAKIYWKNHPVRLSYQVPAQDQAADDWLEYDPHDYDSAEQALAATIRHWPDRLSAKGGEQ